MFYANISNSIIDYESPGVGESYMPVCESCRYGITGIRCPPAAGDTCGR